MNQLQVFNYNGNELRTIEKEGETWWVLKDVCNVLEISNHKMTTQRLDEDERGSVKLTTSGGDQNLTIINDAGLYNVILRSDKPKAKDFKWWVTHEVLPSIRKHGAYMTPETIEVAILNPDTMIKLATALKEEQEKNKVLQVDNSTLTVKNQIMQPKAEYFDELVDRNLLTNFRDTAKELGIKQKDFVGFLLDYKYIYRGKSGNLMPYSRYIDNGIFEMKECYNDKISWKGTQTLITPKGRETFRLLCVERQTA